jgi:hypothetical protein
MAEQETKPHRPGWPRAHPKLSATLVVVVVLAAAGVVYDVRSHPAPPVTVTDGSHVFNANLSGVEKAIHTEDNWVTGTHRPYVSIAVLATMSPRPNAEPLDANATRHAVEGAYLAQYEANHPAGPTGGPGAPLVRLLLADEGGQQDTTAALEAAAGDGQHLVAVTGLGTDSANVTALADQLSAKHIAMVGSVATGDQPAGIAGLVRISPTDTDEARAAVRFLDGNPDPRSPLPADPRVWLIQDENAQDTDATTLGAAFPQALATDHARHYQIVGPGSEYDSSLPGTATLVSARDNGADVCGSRVDVVYFAGRGSDLPGVLAGLARRSCAATRHLTVLTGSDATPLFGRADLWPAGNANMDVYVTGLADPDMWHAQPSVADPATSAWFDSLGYGFGHRFPAERPDPLPALDDGWAIMFHDGVLTAVDAARAAAGSGTAIPSAAAVARDVNQVTVHGASGYLCFDGVGDPINRPIPVIQVSAQGVPTYQGVSSAAGTPTANPCA